MTKYREILRLHSQGISQRNIAASCECSRNTIAKVLKRAEELSISWPLPPTMTDGELQDQLFPQEEQHHRKMPDLEYIHQELNKDGVNLRLLWYEYCETCRRGKEVPFMYSQFCYHYQQFSMKKRASMHIPRKAAEQTEVDWAGSPAHIIDRVTGELIPVSMFVGVLSFSQYAYVEAFMNQNMESWISAHINMVTFFHGVTKIIVPDNLKTGVTKADWYTPEINRTYREFAEYYNTAIIPARVRKPKDKPNAEGSVKIISTWITAALRNQEFFSLAELNAAIREKLKLCNNRPFQKKMGSRSELFTQEEKPLLLPLPATPFELASWKQATVQFNYHISIEKNHYSVPYEYIKQKVEVRITKRFIEVFYNHLRIASHPRIYGKLGAYSTVESHMPKDHQAYVKWDAARFVSWAAKIGPHTESTVKTILSSLKIEQQAFRSCMGLLRLADKYSSKRLEAACAKALSYTPYPSLKSVKTILASGVDSVPTEPTKKTSDEFGFTHGSDYYGRKH